MKPYLIQRCTTKAISPDAVKGPDSLLSYDYMGSSEFEFGALPASLRRIASQIDGYETFKIQPVISANDGSQLWIVCHSRDVVQVRDCAQQLVNRTARTKEHVGLKEKINGAKHAYGDDKRDVWWDIENDYFIVLGEKKAQMVLLAIQRLSERWVKEGKRVA